MPITGAQALRGIKILSDHPRVSLAHRLSYFLAPCVEVRRWRAVEFRGAVLWVDFQDGVSTERLLTDPSFLDRCLSLDVMDEIFDVSTDFFDRQMTPTG